MIRPQPPPIEVFVTEDNIKSGEKRSCMSCPVALALLDLGVIAPNVERDMISFCDPHYGICYFRTPEETIAFLNSFDGIDDEGNSIPAHLRETSFKPFSFVLDDLCNL